METEQKNQTIEISHDFSADVQSLYKAWTEEEQLKQWWRPTGNTLVNVVNELQEGGAVEYHFKEAGLRVTGNYKEVSPNEKLVYSWNWELEDPATEKTEYVLTIRFEAKENGSTLHVLQEGFSNQEEIIPHQDGWEKGLQSLNDHLENGSSTSDTSAQNTSDSSGMGDRSGGYNEAPEQVKVGGG
ncbi:SRPBCC domain-containing protein [Dyadobacter sp. CY326]|uniref:SRPBCC family protein n=1 Tax=Dyadobacter sp. CY326 TaxID=2907300 RepID=UPI001F3061AA|nr:SRPBCC domain-containing protein [Dyadobacter sp. CY326]MCE7063926.1 SRPBCC domain-containing protein [Dyadobacter sp. CY326]